MSRATLQDGLSRAKGCLFGQFAGDALGSLVEFKSSSEIRERYPRGVRDLADGGTWNLLAGQLTDDSEMALCLAHALLEKGRYDRAAALKNYQYWLSTDPFDVGVTTARGLTGNVNMESQANGALMRISPLGIFCAQRTELDGAALAMEDASLTHPHRVCREINALFVTALSAAVRSGGGAGEIYDLILAKAREMGADNVIITRILQAENEPPGSYNINQGWVLTAFHNALWHLLHSPDAETAVIETVGRGGDTDTNGAIVGALLGSIYGIEAFPERWIRIITDCRPSSDNPAVQKPRPSMFWPDSVMEIAEKLYVR